MDQIIANQDYQLRSVEALDTRVGSLEVARSRLHGAVAVIASCVSIGWTLFAAFWHKTGA